MTVNNPVNKWTYAGDGTHNQKIFQYLARIYEASDLVVYLVDAAGVEVLQHLNEDYTVDGVMEEAGGNVTFGTAPADGTTIIIMIELPFTQECALPEAGQLATGPLEIALDRNVKLLQQLKESQSRSLYLPVGSPVSGQLPSPEPHQVLAWNAEGTALVSVPLQITYTPQTIIVDPDPTLDANSDDRVASQKATKSLVATQMALKVGLEGNETISGVKTFGSFPLTPAAAPNTDYQMANKKFVVDAIAAALAGLPGSQAIKVGGIIETTTVYADGAAVAADYGYGTWVAWGSGRVSVGFDAGQTEFNAVEKTGGSKTKNLGHTHPISLGTPSSTGTGARKDTADDPIQVYLSATGFAAASGGSAAQDVLPPYIVSFKWKRTA